MNEHIATRLSGIRDMLMGAYRAGSAMSSSSRGTERNIFVEKFLRDVLPPQYRFGHGDATDTAGSRSGQLDVVVEYPWVPNLPLFDPVGCRLYLAEGVAAVVEVKSNLANQWDEVVSTSAKLRTLVRNHSDVVFGGGMVPPNRIPLFAVGYSGWSTLEAVRRHLDQGVVDGILVIESSLFISVPDFLEIVADDEWSLWGLICCLHRATCVISSSNVGPYLYF